VTVTVTDGGNQAKNFRLRFYDQLWDQMLALMLGAAGVMSPGTAANRISGRLRGDSFSTTLPSDCRYQASLTA
jgi:hypothetical protein